MSVQCVQLHSTSSALLDPLSSTTPDTHGNLRADPLGVVKLVLKIFEILLSEPAWGGETSATAQVHSLEFRGRNRGQARI